MVRFYCPRCWRDFGEDLRQCPFCGLDIHALLRSKDMVERLIIALDHPEPSTPVRAAWLLGRLGDPRAVGPLIDLIGRTSDIYIARAAVAALGEFDTPEAKEALRALLDHAADVLREDAREAMASRSGTKDRNLR